MRPVARLWSYVVLPLPIVGVCAACYAGRFGIGAEVLAPISLLAVCAVAFALALRAGQQ